MDSIKKSKVIKIALLVLAIFVVWVLVNSLRVHFFTKDTPQAGKAQIIDVGGWSLPPGGSGGSTSGGGSGGGDLSEPSGGEESDPFGLGGGFYWGWSDGPFLGWSTSF